VDKVVTGAIGTGLLVYLGVGQGDGERDLDYMVQKICGLRVFRDGRGQMNRSVAEAEGSILAVSQFTLHGDARKGRRPSFMGAMEPVAAEQMYHRFVSRVIEAGIPCATGVFGAMMDVASVNDGPVTILLDSTKLF
jgi:D-tyrosyl-tRNA(Tyr) deacylase